MKKKKKKKKKASMAASQHECEARTQIWFI